MQKLPEASDRKRGGACAKKEASSLSAATSEVIASKSILLLVEGTCVRFKTTRWLTFSTSISGSLLPTTPRLKTPNSETHQKSQTKTPYNGLNN